MVQWWARRHHEKKFPGRPARPYTARASTKQVEQEQLRGMRMCVCMCIARMMNLNLPEQQHHNNNNNKHNNKLALRVWRQCR